MSSDAATAFARSSLTPALRHVAYTSVVRPGGDASSEALRQVQQSAAGRACTRHGTFALGASVAAAVGVMAHGRRAVGDGKKARNSRRATAVGVLEQEDVSEEEGVLKEGEEQAARRPANFYEVLAQGAGGSVPLTFEARRSKQETGQDRVFHWLGRGPKYGSAPFKAVHKYFPGAMPGSAVHLRSTAVLQDEFGFTPSNTLLGTSFCPDEINNQNVDLSTVARKHWGRVFPMGGLGGSPYVGETGFVAFSSHVAKDGNILVLFGPHFGITEAGAVGSYRRDGQSRDSLVCSSVLGAFAACLSGDPNAGKVGEEEYDMQMDEIKEEFAPHVEAISTSENPLASCAYRAWEMVKRRMLKIVNTKFGSGKLVLIGGIQINMPYPAYEDYFLPMMFEMRQEGQPSRDLMDYLVDASTQQDLQRAPWAAATAKAETFAWLSWSPPRSSPVYQALQVYFPGAIPGQAVHRRTIRVVERYGFTRENTILGTSMCPDEINNESFALPVLMQEYWGEVFPMGGLSGAPFTGKTGFKAFSSHVAENGNVIVLFGPHVAVSESGQVGYCRRSGQDNESTACGAVIGAYKACREELSANAARDSAYDMQMDWIKQQIAPHAEDIGTSENPMAALAYQSYKMVKEKLFSVVNNDFGTGYLCLVGGIQINLPNGMEDHFLPCTFELRRAGDGAIDLLSELKDLN